MSTGVSWTFYNVGGGGAPRENQNIASGSYTAQCHNTDLK